MIYSCNAWDKINKKMCKDISVLDEMVVMDYYFDSDLKGFFIREEDARDVHEFVILPYVGVKDVDGVNIHESDIVEFMFDGERKMSVVQYSVSKGPTVTFESFEHPYTFNLKDIDVDYRKIKIIGNHFEKLEDKKIEVK